MFVAGAAAGLTVDDDVTAGLDDTEAPGAPGAGGAALAAPRPAVDIPPPSHT